MIRPRIGITIGDPGGIGPEIVSKALFQKSGLPDCRYAVFGPEDILHSRLKEMSLPDTSPLDVRIIDVKVPPDLEDVTVGAPSSGNGLRSFLSFSEAVARAEAGELDAVVTAPVSKLSWSLAGVQWAGHTDYFQEKYPGITMSFWSENLRVALYSHHIPLREALDRVRKKDLESFFVRLSAQLKPVMSGEFTCLVAGLNPHAGESGLIGEEEKRSISPAIRSVQKRGLPFSGPFPADTIFRMAYGRSDVIVVALYHDQGLSAFKLEAFDTGVNMTLGLPFVRTSPDHGTAFDIAGKNRADPRSLIRSLSLAYQISTGQKE